MSRISCLPSLGYYASNNVAGTNVAHEMFALLHRTDTVLSKQDDGGLEHTSSLIHPFAITKSIAMGALANACYQLRHHRFSSSFTQSTQSTMMALCIRVRPCALHAASLPHNERGGPSTHHRGVLVDCDSHGQTSLPQWPDITSTSPVHH